MCEDRAYHDAYEIRLEKDLADIKKGIKQDRASGKLNLDIKGMSDKVLR